ncbi:hypothetical protein GCK32_022716 [Trichostrongylus colubriformis]|uniref:Uncharacterized protein n=1 Tax=Trichostrongylus colubriformis TaxID=6319 RepID=A0AAN8FRU3_TRICO
MDIRLGELKVIQRNAPYMEPLCDELNEESSGQDSYEMEVIDDTLDEDEVEGKAAEQPEFTSWMACRNTPDMADCLRLLLQQTQASARSFRATCDESENKECYRARRYQEGFISDELQTTMPCVSVAKEETTLLIPARYSRGSGNGNFAYFTSNAARCV